MRDHHSRLLGILIMFLIHPWFGDAQNLIAEDDARYVISIIVDKRDYNKLHKPRTIDLQFDNAMIDINGQPAEVQSLKTRGKTSLMQYRKSLTVELEDKVTIPLNTGDVRMKDFYLISMSLDRHYYYNRFAFDCLKECGIFPLGYRYVEVRVNGQTEGIYLLVERPFDHLLDEIGSPYALRRLRSGEIDKDKVADDIPNRQVNDFRRTYLDLVDRARANSGREAYASLNEALDMSAYFRWLAFNYIVRNGDYTDEVYYYIKPGSTPGRYSIVPWDYDDIFVKEPHEGVEQRRKVLGGKLLFSGEDPLDREIGESAYCYDRYLEELEATLDILSADFMKATMDQIRSEIIPYLSDPKIVEVLKEDFYGGSDVDAMTEHMSEIFNYLVDRDKDIRRRIEINRGS